MTAHIFGLWSVWALQRPAGDTRDRPKLPHMGLLCSYPTGRPKARLSFPAKASSGSLAPMGSGQTHNQDKRNRSKSHLSWGAQLSETIFRTGGEFSPSYTYSGFPPDLSPRNGSEHPPSILTLLPEKAFRDFPLLGSSV